MFHSKMLYKPSLGLLLLRLVVGGIFIYMGYLKFHDMAQTIGFFAGLGLGAFWAYLVTIVEFVGGIFMVIGLFTQLIGFLFTIIMIVAIAKVTGHGGFAASLTPIMIGVTSLALAISGCGRYSTCGMMHGKDCTSCKADGKCSCQHDSK